MKEMKKSKIAPLDPVQTIPECMSDAFNYKCQKEINQDSNNNLQTSPQTFWDKFQNSFELPNQKEGDLFSCFSSFLFDCKARILSEETMRYYRKKINPFLDFLESNNISSFIDISPDLIRHFMLVLEENGHNPGGRHCYFRAVRTFINWCEKEYEPRNWKNPFLKVRAPKVPVALLDPVNIDDVKAMIEKCKNSTFYGARDIAIMVILTDTGVRASELLSMKNEHINFSEKSIRIPNGKGGKARIVFFSDKSKNVIESYLGLRTQKLEYLWTTDEGSKLTYSGLRSIMRRRSRVADVPTPSLHSFRRFFALQMNRNGADIFSIQRLMGHSDIKVLRRYLNQTKEDIRISHKDFGPLTNVFIN